MAAKASKKSKRIGNAVNQMSIRPILTQCILGPALPFVLRVDGVITVYLKVSRIASQSLGLNLEFDQVFEIQTRRDPLSFSHNSVRLAVLPELPNSRSRKLSCFIRLGLFMFWNPKVSNLTGLPSPIGTFTFTVKNCGLTRQIQNPTTSPHQRLAAMAVFVDIINFFDH